MADKVGSLTSSTRCAPVIEAMTGQPIPGDPSTRSSWRFSAIATARASRRTRDTSLPLFSSATPSRAWTMGPWRVFDRNHAPLADGTKPTALAGQVSTQTPHPSQDTVSTSKTETAQSSSSDGPMALNRQCSAQMPQAVHASLKIWASYPPEKGQRARTCGSRTRCRSAGSTSQSATTASPASAKNDATRLVLPVPPFPLMTTSSRGGFGGFNVSWLDGSFGDGCGC